MTPRIRSLIAWVQAFGFDPFTTRSAVQNLPITIREYRLFRRQNANAPHKWRLSFSSPVFRDRDEISGVASGHYFHQDLLVARRIYERNPERHVDIGSRIDGFVAHVAAFRKIEVFDIRVMPKRVTNITFTTVDMMNPGEEYVNYCDSLSCLHALEHFGLGRYGDTVDVDGYKKGFENIARMIRPGGVLYLSMPIGTERVEFNAQRVFSVGRVADLYTESFDLTKFSYIDDHGELHEDADSTQMLNPDSPKLKYGCGIFELVKRSDADPRPATRT